MASAQPVPPGQSVRTTISFAGVNVPSVDPSRSQNAASVTGVANVPVYSYGFNALVLGQTNIYTGMAAGRSAPTVAGFPPTGHGMLLTTNTSAAVTNSRVVGSSYSASSTALFSDGFIVTGISQTPAFFDLVLRLQGTMSRSAALTNVVSRIMLSAGPPAGPASMLYTDTLGQAPLLNGVATGPALVNELTRNVDQTITYRVAVGAGGEPAAVALALNSFSGIGTNGSVGLSASATSNFGGLGMTLQGIAVRNAAGALILPGRFNFTTTSGIDYTYLLIPAPGSAGVLIAAGLQAARRRRRRAAL